MELEFFQKESTQILIKNALISLAIILVLVVEIYYILKFSKYLKTKIDNSKHSQLKDLNIDSVNLIKADRKKLILKKIVDILTLITIIIDIYVTLILILYVFPGTEDTVNTIIEYTTTPIQNIGNAIVNFIPTAVSIIVYIIIFRFAIKSIKTLRDAIEKKSLSISGFDADWAKPTAKIIIFLLYVFLIVLIFPLLPGSDSNEFKGIAALIGILISITGGSSISNFLAGIVLTYMKPFKVGDKIMINDTVGVVTARNPFAIKLLTIKNEEVTIPNNGIVSSNTTNYSSSGKTILHTTISIGYDVKHSKVNELLVNASSKTDGILNKPQPFILQKSLEDFYIVYELNFFVSDVIKQPKIISELHAHILDEFNAAGIEILSPHYEAGRDGESSTVIS
ncbi:mechanosensitive ion channel family protein [Aquimarina sp. 2201CG5-10]|uniref:mechanosensitive ion channel family protein n=1 Tax=Aquimarina callyspongiae TaxID=3098150 RepID=UPI002AB3A192|nr:mechanosensitive ion channel domain-containing protein [Aquimarina sp. 2201CG5-10]MDY8135406.1 mechanosensitive ion channel [Aquimarina sp. 2201CG5-10]